MNKGCGRLSNLLNVMDQERTVAIIHANADTEKAISRYNFMNKKWEDVHATKMSAECTVPVKLLKKLYAYKKQMADMKLMSFSTYRSAAIPELYENGVKEVTAIYIFSPKKKYSFGGDKK